MLSESFKETAAAFQDNIADLAEKAGLEALEVYAMWLEYAEQCRVFDQSAILWEFTQWYADKLTPVEAKK